MNGTLLIVVDMNEDFVRPNGKLPVPNAENIVPNVKRVVEAQRRVGGKVLFTSDDHPLDDPEFEMFGEHCVKGTEGQKICSEIAPDNPVVVKWDDMFSDTLKQDVLESEEVLLTKNKTNLFLGSSFSQTVIEQMNPLDIVIVGVATDVCVDEAVMGCVDLGYDVTVVYDAIKGLNITPDEEVFDKWSKKGVLMIDTDTFEVSMEVF